MSVETVRNDITAAFIDVIRPNACTNYTRDGIEGFRLIYVIQKTWVELATDLQFMAMHSFDEILLMNEQCFAYYFPGYLLAVISLERVFVEMVVDSLRRILNPSESDHIAQNIAASLSARLTSGQKRALVHWIELEITREKDCLPDWNCQDAHQTDWQVALVIWREGNAK